MIVVWTKRLTTGPESDNDLMSSEKTKLLCDISDFWGISVSL